MAAFLTNPCSSGYVTLTANTQLTFSEIMLAATSETYESANSLKAIQISYVPAPISPSGDNTGSVFIGFRHPTTKAAFNKTTGARVVAVIGGENGKMEYTLDVGGNRIDPTLLAFEANAANQTILIVGFQY